MIPVYQTRFGGPDAPAHEKGNCYSACIASLLEIPLEKVPSFHVLMEHEGREWGYAISKWLRAWGFWHVIATWTPEFDEDTRAYGTGHYILSGRSPRIDAYHSVVAEGGYIVHDPSPSGGGLRKPSERHPWYVEVLVPIDYADHQRDQVWVQALSRYSPDFNEMLKVVGYGDPSTAVLTAIHAERRSVVLRELTRVVDRAERADEPITRQWANNRILRTP